jgi:putative PIN family toxin of toxin-antitoxin system
VRVVLDTNVVVSGVLWRGTPYRLLEKMRNQYPRLKIYSSTVLLDELTDVFIRPYFSGRLAQIGKTAREVLTDYVELVELVEPMEVPRIVRDPDDNHVLACALAARAELIVSGDRDLLDLGTFRDVRILNPSEALPAFDAS